MSYILEALKKSDQQRQRSAAPTLPAATVTVVATKQPVYYGLLAAVLLGGGIVIGLLRPWQPAHESPEIAAKSPQASQQVAPAPLYRTTGKTAQELPRMNSVSVAAPAVRMAAQPDTPAAVSAAKPGAVAPAPITIAMAELPLSIQQEIPAMAIQFHAYSSKPANRLVGVNSLMLHEGESLMPGLRLEQITPEGMIFSYKGYRFLHGIQ
jgi:general secretion pathway protein B